MRRADVVIRLLALIFSGKNGTEYDINIGDKIRTIKGDYNNGNDRN